MKKFCFILSCGVLFLLFLFPNSPAAAIEISYTPSPRAVVYPIGISQLTGLLSLLSLPITTPAPVLLNPILPILPIARVQGTVLPTTPVVTPTVVALPPPPVPVVIVTTNWIGAWYAIEGSVGPQTGTLTLQLIHNTSTGALSGIVDFGVNSLIPEPVPMTGFMLPGATTFELEGIYYDPLDISRIANIDLVGTLTSSTTISGTYSILSWHGPSFGRIYLTLL
ncbi:MAG: hypothetical protein ACMUJM_22550 [bacterium]